MNTAFLILVWRGTVATEIQEEREAQQLTNLQQRNSSMCLKKCEHTSPLVRMERVNTK